MTTNYCEIFPRLVIHGFLTTCDSRIYTLWVFNHNPKVHYKEANIAGPDSSLNWIEGMQAAREYRVRQPIRKYWSCIQHHKLAWGGWCYVSRYVNPTKQALLGYMRMPNRTNRKFSSKKPHSLLIFPRQTWVLIRNFHQRTITWNPITTRIVLAMKKVM